MSFFFAFFAFFLFSSEVKSCPGPTWIHCANHDGICPVVDQKLATVAYGSPTSNRWSFVDFSNDFSTSNVLNVYCGVHAFGSFAAGESKICCYNPRGSSFINNIDENTFTDNTNWATWISHGQGDNLPTTLTNNYEIPMYVRYGSVAAGRFMYRIMSKKVHCDHYVFMDVAPGYAKVCTYYKIADTLVDYNLNTDFLLCGTSTANSCNLQASPPISNKQVRLVSFGSGDDYYFRYMMGEAGSIVCSAALFDDPIAGTKFCYVLKQEHSLYFQQPTGRWNLAVSCQGCDSIVKTLEEGVSSSTEESTSEEWSRSISHSVEVGASYEVGNFGVSASYSMTEETSKAVAYSMATSFEKSLTSSCEASCESDGTGTQELKIYQWVLSVTEDVQLNPTNTNVFQCSFKCITDGSQPQCPLHMCGTNPNNCVECT